MSFDTPPVISALQDVLAIFRYFQFDHHQTAVLSQCQQVYRPDAKLRSACSSELCVQWRDDQTRIEFSDVSAQE
jgi:hypothetical protein